MKTVPSTDLIRCEVKYSGEGIDKDLAFLEYSLTEMSGLSHYFIWIPWHNTPLKTESIKKVILSKTQDSTLKFLYGEPVSPFRFSLYEDGEERFSNDSSSL